MQEKSPLFATSSMLSLATAQQSQKKQKSMLRKCSQIACIASSSAERNDFLCWCVVLCQIYCFRPCSDSICILVPSHEKLGAMSTAISFGPLFASESENFGRILDFLSIGQ